MCSIWMHGGRTDISVMAAYYDLWGVCAVRCVSLCAHTAHSTQHRTTSMYPHWTECVILAMYWLWLPDKGFTVKGKVKVALWGLFNTAAVRPILFLPPTSYRIQLQRRHASYRCARTLPAKAGTITNEFSKQIRNSRKFTRFFYMPQSWDMGHIILLLLRRKTYRGFFRTPEKFNGFGRVWTRELGFQWPVC